MSRDEAWFTIGEVAKITGVKIPTIRGWEKRHGLLAPARSTGRFRMYSAADVEKIRTLKERILDEKVPPRVIARLSAVPEIWGTGRPDAKTEERPGQAEMQQTTPASEEARPETGPAWRLKALYQAIATIAAAVDLPHVLRQAVALGCEVLEMDVAVLLLLEEPLSGAEPRLSKIAWGLHTWNIADQYDRTLYHLIVEQQHAIVTPDTSGIPGLNLAENGRPARSLLALPLTTCDGLAGIIYFETATGRLFRREEISFGRAFAQIVACGVENAKLRRDVKAADQRYRHVVENSSDVIFAVDGAGLITFMGHRAHGVLGYEPASVIGKPFASIVARKCREDARRYLRLDALDGERDGPLGLDLLRRDGSIASVEIRATTVASGGIPLACQGVIHDHSERVRLERKLLERTKELAALNKIATTLSQSLDPDEVMELAVGTVMEITGMEIGVLWLVDQGTGEIALKVHQGAPPGFVESASRIRPGTGVTGRVAITGEPIVIENIAEDPRTIKTERIQHRSLVCVPLKSRERVLGVMGLVSKKQRPVTAEDVQLLSSVAHLIGAAIENARLHGEAVRSHGERLIVMHDKLSEITAAQREERRRLARELHDDVVQQIASLVAELEAANEKTVPLETVENDHVRRTLGEVLGATQRLLSDLRGESVEGRNLCRLVDELIQRHARQTGWETKLDVDGWPEGVPPDVTFHLYRIVQEALGNARKHANARHVEVTLSVGAQHVAISVRDDGVGFTPETPRATAPSPTSFGLTGIRERVHLLGGNLRIDSRPGAGTSIEVVVPRYWEKGHESEPLRVLIVDEHVLFGDALAAMLTEEEQIQVVGVAHSAHEASQLARKLSPHLILMDIHSPDKAGVQATRMIRAENAAARVVLLTAFPNEQGALEGLRAGAMGLVPKTASRQELLRALRSAMRGEPAISPDKGNRTLGLFQRGPEEPIERSPFDGLTPREVYILRMLAFGHGSKEIGRTLSITDKTVRWHISNIYQKLRIYDRAQLVLYAVRKGLIHIESSI